MGWLAIGVRLMGWLAIGVRLMYRHARDEPLHLP
jgi:hypothetical protein